MDAVQTTEGCERKLWTLPPPQPCSSAVSAYTPKSEKDSSAPQVARMTPQICSSAYTLKTEQKSLSFADTDKLPTPQVAIMTSQLLGIYTYTPKFEKRILDPTISPPSGANGHPPSHPTTIILIQQLIIITNHQPPPLLLSSFGHN